MIDKKQFIYSQTSLRSYLYCPKQFKLKYIDQIKWPAEKNQPRMELEKAARDGALFHRMAEQYFLKIPVKLIEDQIEQYENGKVLAYWQNFLSFTKNNFNLSEPQLIFKPERSIRTRLDGYNLEAKFDLLIDQGQDNWLAFDWKTSKLTPRMELELADSPQTKVYLIVLSYLINKNEIKANKPAILSYLFVGGAGQLAEVKVAQEQVTGYKNELNKLIDQIVSDEEYQPTDDLNKCANCPFRAYCGMNIATAKFEEFDNGADAYDRFLEDQDHYTE